MFKLQDMLKEEDGYHIVTIHAKDTVFRQAIVAGMNAVGYEPYSFSQHEDGNIQYAFVTQAKKKELHEHHLHSCRNSLGRAEEILGEESLENWRLVQMNHNPGGKDA